MIKFEDIKKLLENSNLKFKEAENGLVIFKEDEYNHLFEIKQILRTFGITDNDLTLNDEGTVVNAKQYDSQKLKMLLSPFYPLEKLKVIDPYHLLIQDLFVDTLNEDDGGDVSADGSADDLGEVPTNPEALVTIDELADMIDKEFPDVEIVIVDDSTLELPPAEEVIEFLKSIENQLENFDIVITDDKITVKGK
jgi:hypothetical protein